jgi:hypothetical protein
VAIIARQVAGAADQRESRPVAVQHIRNFDYLYCAVDNRPASRLGSGKRIELPPWAKVARMMRRQRGEPFAKDIDQT